MTERPGEEDKGCTSGSADSSAKPGGRRQQDTFEEQKEVQWVDRAEAPAPVEGGEGRS